MTAIPITDDRCAWDRTRVGNARDVSKHRDFAKCSATVVRQPAIGCFAAVYLTDVRAKDLSEVFE